ncbi:MAG: peptidoglycan DD-metalloendopeptidase family protein, partial [Actinomycetota bacterium]|nr:peptidoglycan DD-metalloendopeptidase family protein [Actinomycetota bacterium]
LLLPAVTSAAGPRDRLEKVKEKREAVQEKIEIHEAEAADLRANIRALDADIDDLRQEVSRLDTEIAEISSKVRSVQARIDATQAEIDKIKDVATDQAVMLYKTGATDTLDALLSSRSLTELNDRIELLGVASEKNTNALIRYGRLRVTIEAEHRELFQIKTDLEAARATQKNTLAKLDKAYEEHAANLAALEKKLGKEHAHEEILARQEARIERDILAAQAGRAVAARGISAGGFIWPLAGSITSYYGPRWGRMHTGIDIDGSSGQPIVASKAGRVIVASYYGGYGNAVVVDHGGGVSTLYAHMSRFGVSNGQEISQGQVVGYVGCTGSCTGDHLHFEVRVNGSPVNPLDYLP